MAKTNTSTTPAYAYAHGDDGGDGDLAFPTLPLDDAGDLGMLFDWQRAGFDGTDTLTTLIPPLEAAVRDDAPPPEPIQEKEAAPVLSSSIPTPENRRSAYVRQLTALAADVDTVYRGMPAASSFRPPNDQPIEKVLASYSEIFNPQPLLELLFSSGQILIDLYPDVLEMLFSPGVQQRFDDYGCLHGPEHIHASDGDVPWLGHAAELDVFLFNLLVLCHTRLLDIFEKLLSHAALCAKISLAHPNSGREPPRVNVPELRVGSFVASASSSSTMQAVLLAHIAAVLKTRSQQLSRKLSETLGGSDSDEKRSMMLRLQCEVLEESSGDRVKQLQEVKDRLNDLGIPI